MGPPRNVTGRDNVVTRKRLKALRRRAEFLDDRIKRYMRGEGSPSRDKAELAALRWAISIAEAWIEADPNRATTTHSGDLAHFQKGDE